jgi:hypothetical protein
VLSWLSGKDDGIDTTITGITAAGEQVNVGLIGMTPPPPAQALAQAISAEAGREVEVTVSWIQGFYQTSEATSPEPNNDDRLTARATADQWTSASPGLDVLRVGLEGGMITVDLVGTTAKPDTTGLVAAINTRLGRPVEITVRYLRLTTLAG